MKKAKTILVGALMGAMLATPVLGASGDACLQYNRLWAWHALDERTIIATDRTMHRYTISMDGACTGLNMGGAVLVFRIWTNLGCLAHGDLIGVRNPGLGFVSCYIGSIQAGAPATGS